MLGLALQSKIDCYLGGNLDRISFQIVGLVTPLLHRVNGGVCQHCWATDVFKVLNRTVFRNHCPKQNRALDSRSSRFRWVDGRDFVDNVSGRKNWLGLRVGLGGACATYRRPDGTLG